MPFKIAIVDDKPQVLISIIEEMKGLGGADVVFTARNGEDYLQQMKGLPAEERPKLVLMDIDMPVMNGIDAVSISTQLYEGVEYIMFTVFDGDEKLFEALKAGARGYLLKNESSTAILRAIEDLLVHRGAPMSSSIARKALNILVNTHATESETKAEAESTLTTREMETLKGLVNGLNYKQLAAKFSVSPHTVRNHIANIYTKLHISTRAQAVKLAIKNKWI